MCIPPPRADVSSAESWPASPSDSPLSHATNRDAYPDLNLSIQCELFCCVSCCELSEWDLVLHVNRDINRVDIMVAFSRVAEQFVHLLVDYLGLGHCASRARTQMHLSQLQRHPSVLSGILEDIQ